MKNFEFVNPVKIYFGKEQISKLALELIPYKKIMLIYGQGSIKSNGVYNQIKLSLKDKEIVEFRGVEPNPVYETLMKAVELARKEKVEFLIAAGGGSVIDGTKFIAAAIKYEAGDPWNIVAKGEKISEVIKFGAVLTLPATGSEMNSGAVITRKSYNEKLAFGSPLLFPVFSILDPETMYSLSDSQIANGIVDAFVHVIEQYLTFPMNAAVQDAWAVSLLNVLRTEGVKALENRNDYDANANLMWAACMALNGLLTAGVYTDWSTHMIGHEITALFGIDHARTLAIVLPGVLTAMKEDKREKLLHYARNVWNISTEDEERAISDAIFKTEEFFISLGIGVKLSDYNIPDSAIETICEKLKKKNYTKLGEKRNINPDVVREILFLRK
ncbi:MAG: iron-containing alcohol dehydrogenase [Bacteroidales bacterium]|nr:iron-containing alcohol dehydrogenase [Bacteroidales bacterium]